MHATAELFRRHGYTATGLKQISAQSGAPFGSLYHFFPGGKEHLAAETLRVAGAMYQQLVEAVFDASPDPGSGVHAVFEGAAETLRQTDYADACPIETVALEVASTNETLRLVTADIFEDWIAAATDRLTEVGVAAPKARDLAIVLVAALEGAFVLSRAAKTTEALEAVDRVFTPAVREAVTAVRKASKTGLRRATSRR